MDKQSAGKQELLFLELNAGQLLLSAVPDHLSEELLHRFQTGQDQAASAIFDRYLERLLALARSRIAPKLKRRIDPEDVVQSAYRSFFVHAANREYQLARSGDLWRLLASTTLNKLYGQIEQHTAARRSVEREAAAAIDILRSHEPAIVDVVAAGEQLRLAVENLSPDEQAVLTATLEGQSIAEIGRAIAKSERTVRRLLTAAKRQFEHYLLEEASSKSKNAVRAPELHAPLKFSDYVLEKLIGAGGMGKVYRARDKLTGETVAIKALHKARQSDERATAQLVHESQMLARLRHPNIVGVRGLGRFPGGGFFIVMQFVDGRDLQSRLNSGPLALADVVPIIRQVAAAVQHAHEHGIVHCDLKPGNVILDRSNRALVTDFGFAVMLAERSAASARRLGGTAGYMAPEILTGQSMPTVSADIFALGVLLWRLATGNLPHTPASIHAKNEALLPLAVICRRCIDREPSRRHPSVAALIAELDNLTTA